MTENEFFKKLYSFIDFRQKQISDIYGVLSQLEKKINNYEKEDEYNKLLIDNLLNHSIVISVSSFQGLLEELTLLFENYILDNNIEINKLNKTIYDLIYKKYNTRIIRDHLIYGENIKVNDLGS